MKAASTTYHCELAWRGGDAAAAEPDVAIQVQGERIVAVTVGVAPPAGATRLAGLTLPGLVNAHSHAFHRALRGRTHADGGSFWTWREEMYAVARRLDPSRYHDLAKAVFGEMALAGMTTVGEFHYLHHSPRGRPYEDANAMGAALVAAARAAGVRLTLLDTCYLQGGPAGEALNEVQQRYSDGDAMTWAGRAAEAADRFTGPGVRAGAAIHSVRAVAPDAMATVAGWAADRGLPLHAHVSEQPAENTECMAAFGLTPTALLARAGALSDRFTAVHATHLADGDIASLGAATTFVALCPTTERDLADGIGPGTALRERGARLTLGTDSHALIDLFEEARAVELDERLLSHHRGHHEPAALLRAATVDGAASLGWPDAGRIEAGALADLCSVRLDTVRTAGATAASALATAVFAAGAADVHHVLVGGEVVVAEGRHTQFDVAAELGRSIGQLLSDQSWAP